MRKDRIWWIDALRAIAILMIIVPHFISAFCPEYFIVWQRHSMIMKGISGKHGVAVFCVFIGYFASQKKSISILEYAVRRYLQFAVNIFIVLLPFAITKTVLLNLPIIEIVQEVKCLFWDSFGFNNTLNPTLWCVRDMFFGSLVSFVLGNCCMVLDKRKELGFVLALSMFVYFVDVWVSVCLLGVALRVFMEYGLSKKLKIVLCVLFVVAIPLLYRHDESYKTYLMQGVSCCLFVYICKCLSDISCFDYCPRLVLLPFLGECSFYLFLWHTPVNMVLGVLSINCSIPFLFIISFFVSLLLSIVQNVINIKWIIPMINRIRIV